MTDNGRTYPSFAFTFGPPPKRPTSVVSNSNLTIIPGKIMANGHAFCRMSYKGVGAAMCCNMTGNITFINAKGYKMCFSNIWLSPECAAHKKQSAQASKWTKLMTNFLNKAGKKYWEKTTEWEKLRCL